MYLHFIKNKANTMSKQHYPQAIECLAEPRSWHMVAIEIAKKHPSVLIEACKKVDASNGNNKTFRENLSDYIEIVEKFHSEEITLTEALSRLRLLLPGCSIQNIKTALDSKNIAHLV